MASLGFSTPPNRLPALWLEILTPPSPLSTFEGWMIPRTQRRDREALNARIWCKKERRKTRDPGLLNSLVHHERYVLKPPDCMLACVLENGSSISLRLANRRTSPHILYADWAKPLNTVNTCRENVENVRIGQGVFTTCLSHWRKTIARLLLVAFKH